MRYPLAGSSRCNRTKYSITYIPDCTKSLKSSIVRAWVETNHVIRASKVQPQASSLETDCPLPYKKGKATFIGKGTGFLY